MVLEVGIDSAGMNKEELVTTCRIYTDLIIPPPLPPVHQDQLGKTASTSRVQSTFQIQPHESSQGKLVPLVCLLMEKQASDTTMSHPPAGPSQSSRAHPPAVKMESSTVVTTNLDISGTPNPEPNQSMSPPSSNLKKGKG
ncbi:uncharacterized protein MELLADRAFT_114396 [Melampsora larici-populina 98AG31]|uniref:Uncharacterized protein n=1 Tax=Melampsora larici-populina (strain 98AG31 / pathotype 3-4-7) TaxID=747676 RepID=F4SDA7_MELLP|nr:uncharacterized protein MELLADRAFT_114396 [Melampsora larici-populina 98AG31]EGF97365.1 hypothetical protein MELLADRAFT_114396 [Melampsora larici-populina 98AG31]